MKKTFKYAVYWYYGNSRNPKGTIVSRHKTRQAADTKANQSTFWGVKSL